MNTPITAFSALIDISEEEQCDEIEDYLRGKGAEITADPETQLFTRLQQIIEICNVIFQDQELPQQEVEGFFYSVVSLLHVVPADMTEQFVDILCQKVSAGANHDNGLFKLKLLGLIFCHLGVRDPRSFVVICHRLRLAKEVGMTSTIALDVEKVRKWVEGWHLTEPQTRELYQLMWEAFCDSGNKSLTSQILIELLKTYSSKDAHKSVELAQRLIVLVISDPNQFLFDHVLSLEPVAALSSQNIYQLLMIFVSEKLSSFTRFYETNKDFVDGLGLDYNYCVHKMRLLTLTSLAVESSEVSFSVLCSELNLPREEVEMVVLEAIRLKLVEARISQVSQRVIVMSSIHRTFDLEHWKVLHECLSSWKQNIHSVKGSLEAIKT